MNFRRDTQDLLRYLGMPAHIANAYDPRDDSRTFRLRGGWVEHHGKCLAPVQDLDYSAVKRPDLKIQSRMSERGEQARH
jgi:hypothetical protein